MHYYEESLYELTKKNKEVVILTAENRFSMRNLPNLIGEKFIDVGIMEQNLVGVSAGLSKCGKIPIMHALSAFLTMRSFEFIRTDLGYPNLKSIIVGTFTGFNSQANGPTHQAIEDIGLMRLIPNLKIFAPSNIYEMCNIFKIIDQFDSPLYLRYNDDTEINYGSDVFNFGENIKIKDGKNIAILTYGINLKSSVKASELLEKKKIFPSIYNFRFMNFKNDKYLKKILNTYSKLVVIEDHFSNGGLTSIVKEESYNQKINNKLLEINLEDRFFKPSLINDVLEHEGFTPKDIYNKILNFLK
tara:strand:+ start:713 stop:1615 length:903 start_codon:yes stop_codon:yes gene_type:complete